MGKIDDKKEDQMKSDSTEERAPHLRALPQGFLALAACMLLSIAVIASYPAIAHAEGKNGIQPSSERIVSHLKGRLNLTDDQVNKIRPIMEESMQKQAALRDQMLQLRQSTDAKISAVLTPEQQKEFQQLNDKRREGMRSRMHRPDGPSEEQP
jgi:protein CpxP